MRIITPLSLLPALLHISTTLATTTAVIRNYCPEDIFLNVNNKGPYTLPTGQAFLNSISGDPNTAIIAKNDNFFSPDTPKAVWGTSSSEDVLYWSLAAQNGDPFYLEHFNVTSDGTDATGVYVDNLCQNTTTYDGQVHACQDSGDVHLYLFACAFNAAG